MTGAGHARWSSIDPHAFRELRAVCGLSVGEVAQLLRVSARSVRYWEAGQRRIPCCAFKLLRVVVHGDVGGRLARGRRRAVVALRACGQALYGRRTGKTRSPAGEEHGVDGQRA